MRPAFTRPGTVSGHLANVLEAGEPLDPGHAFTPAEAAEMQAAFDLAGWATLSGAHEVLGGRVASAELRLFLAFRQTSNW